VGCLTVQAPSGWGVPWGPRMPPSLLPRLFWQARCSSSGADRFWPARGRCGATPCVCAVPRRRGASMHAQHSAPITAWNTND
jgi:hypothetical protein